jgi:hypothetical protein
MPLSRRCCILLLGVMVLLAGCATHAVRHLASDASLITIGKSTRNDVLTYLGEPDSERMVSPDTKQWVYFEEKRTLMQKAPLVGRAFSPEGYGMVLITFKGDLVIDCRYSSFSKDEFNWAGSYPWQDVKE